jgi:hypothetical protein
MTFRNTDDPRGAFPKERTEVFDVDRQNNAALGESKLVDVRVGKAGEIEIMLDVFDVEVVIETRENLPGW